MVDMTEGEFSLAYWPTEKKPLSEWLKPQGRFRHLFKGDHEGLIDQIQDEVDRDWQKLLKRAGDAIPEFAGPIDFRI